MISNLVVTHRQQLPHFQIRVYDGFTVEATKNKFVLIIAVIDSKPHPFALARILVSKFDLYVIAGLINRHE